MSANDFDVEVGGLQRSHEAKPERQVHLGAARGRYIAEVDDPFRRPAEALKQLPHRRFGLLVIAGELQYPVREHLLERSQVTQLGDVLAGLAPGRTSAEEITTFDSTGLAIQDLALALAVLERIGELKGVLEFPL